MITTVCWRTRERLKRNEIDAALTHVLAEHDPAVLRVYDYQPGFWICLEAAAGDGADKFTLNLARGEVALGFFDVNGTEGAGNEIQQLLDGVNGVLNGKLDIFCQYNRDRAIAANNPGLGKREERAEARGVAV